MRHPTQIEVDEHADSQVLNVDLADHRVFPAKDAPGGAGPWLGFRPRRVPT
jgi:hypothetical protein